MKKTVKITLDINEIVYDIQNKTYLTGKSRSDSLSHERVASMQANDDDENADQILRSIATAASVLRTKLSEYMESDSAAASNSPIVRDSPLSFSLLMPSNYNPATADTIAFAAHDFIVCRAVADWFVITDKPDAEDYGTAAEKNLAVISEALNKRHRPMRASS